MINIYNGVKYMSDKVYIRGVPIGNTNTINMTVSANYFISQAILSGSLTTVEDIETEINNGVMFFIIKGS